MVYDEHCQFYGYDPGDVSDHGYDYESDDLPAGCLFEDDSENEIKSFSSGVDDGFILAAQLSTLSMATCWAAHGPAAASQPNTPAMAPAACPHQGSCVFRGQHPFITESNNTFDHAMVDDSVESPYLPPNTGCYS